MGVAAAPWGSLVLVSCAAANELHLSTQVHGLVIKLVYVAVGM